MSRKEKGGQWPPFLVNIQDVLLGTIPKRNPSSVSHLFGCKQLVEGIPLYLIDFAYLDLIP